MNEEIINSLAYQCYVDACIMIKPYCKMHERIPEGLKNSYEQAIKDYRRLLEMHGYYMPKQKYPYNKEDKGTWRYLSPKKLLKFGNDNTINVNWIYLNKRNLNNEEIARANQAT